MLTSDREKRRKRKRSAEQKMKREIIKGRQRRQTTREERGTSCTRFHCLQRVSLLRISPLPSPVVFLVTSFRFALPLPRPFSLFLSSRPTLDFFPCALSSLPSRSTVAGSFFESVQFLSRTFTCYGIFIVGPESDTFFLSLSLVT